MLEAVETNGGTHAWFKRHWDENREKLNSKGDLQMSDDDAWDALEQLVEAFFTDELLVGLVEVELLGGRPCRRRARQAAQGVRSVGLPVRSSATNRPRSADLDRCFLRSAVDSRLVPITPGTNHPESAVPPAARA